MKLVSWNVNGIRAVWKKGFPEWLKKARPDVLCVQETRAWPEQLEPEQVAPRGHARLWAGAEQAA